MRKSGRKKGSQRWSGTEMLFSIQARYPTYTKGECRSPKVWGADHVHGTRIISPATPRTPSKFRNFFRVPLDLYWNMPDTVVAAEPAFEQRRDNFGRLGHSSHQKSLSASRRLGSKMSYNQMDDMCRMAPETHRQYFQLLLNTTPSQAKFELSF